MIKVVLTCRPLWPSAMEHWNEDQRKHADIESNPGEMNRYHRIPNGKIYRLEINITNHE